MRAQGAVSPLMHWSCCCVFLQANPLQEEGSHEGFSQLLRDFEQWLEVENAKLVRIIAMRTATAKDLKTREMKLQVCSHGKALCPQGLPPWMCLPPGSSSKKKKSTHMACEPFLLVYK